jgi:AAA15 family ATPase/GTPase
VLDDSHSVTLGAIGNGAVTWASVLIVIFDVIESIKNEPQADMPVLLLIDEMGAGIHYSIMLNVWKYLRDFTQQYRNIQFVFTTHSDDCVRAYCEAFSGSNTAKIIRLHQTATDKRIISTDYLEGEFSRIAEGDWEVRG